MCVFLWQVLCLTYGLHIGAKQLQLKGGTGSLPITDASKRATPLQPSEWREMLKNAQRPIVLDVRNNYEWDAGHFEVRSPSTMLSPWVHNLTALL